MVDLAIMGLGVAVGGILGWLMSRGGRRGPALVLAALMAAGAAAMMLQARGRDGFDALGPLIIALLMLAPVALGLALGAWWGGRRR